MKSKAGAVFLGLVCLTCLSPKASGEFVGGVESFNGTAKDTITWEEHIGYSQFSQNNRLELVVPPTGLDICDYTTRNIMVGVGQSVSVEIHNCQVSSAQGAGSNSGLYLTNDSLGTSDDTFEDSKVIGLEYIYSSGSGSFFPCYGGGGSFSGLGFGANTPPPSFSDPYLFTITRLTGNSAYYSVHHLNTMQVIGSRTLFFSGFDNNLYISLMANVPTVWDNVIIPEPTSLCLIFLGAGILFRKK